MRTRITASLAIPFAILDLAALSVRDLRYPVTAAVLYLASFLLFAASAKVSVGMLAACGDSCVSAAVLCRGPFRIVRHPFYASYNLAWIAGFVATLWWPAAVAAFVMAIIYERFARAEERGLLNGPLAADYSAYRRRTGRYIPGL